MEELFGAGTTLLQAAINAIAVVIMVVFPMFGAWIILQTRTLWERQSENLPEELVWIIEQVARLVVTAVEQMARDNQIEWQDRKSVALARLDSFLRELGYEIDLSVLDTAIEAAVGWLNNIPGEPEV